MVAKETDRRSKISLLQSLIEYFRDRDPQKLLIFATELLITVKKDEDEDFMIKCWYAMAAAQLLLGQSTLQLLLKALPIARERKNQTQIASILTSLEKG